ncbi:MAG: DUF5647 family protein [Thermodesulfovibrionales bacterium]
MKLMEKKHAILVTEFDRYVVEHPEFAKKLPWDAQIVLQVEIHEKFPLDKGHKRIKEG